ncbi:MAG: TolC family outer membrane protein [Hyphomicrobiales bacterium]
MRKKRVGLSIEMPVSQMFRYGRLLAMSAIVFVGSASVATSSENLRSALAKAYLKNPELAAERARQRATDEAVPQALSGWRPTVVANGDYGGDFSKSRTRVYDPVTGQRDTVTVTDDRDTGGFTIALNQPIFDGFKTVYSTKAAEATVDAGRQSLLGTEQAVLLDAVTAYVDVIRDRSIVVLRLKNVEALREQLRASQARFDVGEITRTDVAQSKARLAEAESALTVARANVAASEAFYQRVIGKRPIKLRQPNGPLAKLPRTLKSALSMAEQTNPTILAASFNEEASRFNIDVVRGDLLPSVSLQAQYGAVHRPSANVRTNQTGLIFGAITIPLYQGGGVYSRVREAKQVNSQRRLQILDARRIVRQNVVTSWSNIRAADEALVSANEQVKANELAYAGVKQENLVGSRTTLDVLNAESELLDSKVSVVLARREQVISRYQLIASVGKLTSEYLNLGVAQYDPTVNYNQVRDKLFGAEVDESE